MKIFGIIYIFAYFIHETLSNFSLSNQNSHVKDIIDWNNMDVFNNKDIYKYPRNVYTSVGSTIILEW